MFSILTKSYSRSLLACIVSLVAASRTFAFDRPETVFQIFQFPADKIPRIDGDASDWAMVPVSYLIGSDQLTDDSTRKLKFDARNLDVRVRVGWVKGLNRLYFLYEATDNYWDFSRVDLHNDTFELVVDGDASGGPLIDRQHPHKDTLPPADTYFPFHGVQAQNYHISPRTSAKTGASPGARSPGLKNSLGPTLRNISPSSPASPAITRSSFGSRPSITPAPKAPRAPSSPSCARTNSSASAGP